MTTAPRIDALFRTTGGEGDAHHAASPASLVALATALDRIESVLAAEEAVLSGSGDIDLEDVNHRKSHCLLELTRISRMLPREGVSPELVTRIEAIRDRLLENRETLRTHLAAAQEISRVLTEALGDAESDGTYSRLAAAPANGAGT